MHYKFFLIFLALYFDDRQFDFRSFKPRRGLYDQFRLPSNQLKLKLGRFYRNKALNSTWAFSFSFLPIHIERGKTSWLSLWWHYLCYIVATIDSRSMKRKPITRIWCLDLWNCHNKYTHSIQQDTSVEIQDSKLEKKDWRHVRHTKP